MLADLLNTKAWLDYRRIRFWAALLILLYTLAGFLLLPWLLQRYGPELAFAETQRETTIEEIRFNPWLLRLEVDNFILQDDADGVLARVDALTIDIDFTRLLRLTLGFDEITLRRPVIDLKRYAFADTNWGRMLNDIEAATAASAEEAPPPAADDEELPLYIATLTIKDGEIILEDALTVETFNTTIAPINIAVNDLSTLADVEGAQSIRLLTENGVEIVWEGKIDLNPLVSAGTITIEGSPLPTLYRYLKDQLNFTLGNCCLEIALDYNAIAVPNGDLEVEISNANAKLRNLELASKADGSPIFNMPLLEISGGQLSWPAQIASVEQIRVADPELYVVLDKNGVANLETLVSDEGTAEPTAAETDAPEESAPWDVSVSEFSIENMRFDLTDMAPSTPGRVTLAPLALTVRDISLADNSRWPIEFSSELISGGKLAFAGSVVAFPAVEAEGGLTATALELTVAEPWVEDAASIELDKGALTLSLDVRSGPTETLQVAGDIAVTELGINDTSRDEPLVGWRELRLDGLQFELDKNALQLATVSVNEPFVRINIAEDGSTNFDTLTTDTEPAAEAPAEPAPAGEPVNVRVGKTTVNGGRVDFSDQTLPLPFRVLIQEFKGTASAFDSNSIQPSALDFDGRVGDFGLMTLTGDVSIMAPTEQTDVRLDFRNLFMPKLSPYTAEFVGRKIESGKLNLDLDYTLQNNKVVGANNIVITDFKLGEEVESEDAVSLPLDLGIALLTDTNGVIDLDLEVSGDLDDPGFSASGIIIKAFTNVITKAATAPFKLLGGLIPGGEDMNLEAVEFKPGSADLTPPEREKLTLVSAALTERPVLNLRFAGGYDVATDGAALRSEALNNQVIAITGNAEEVNQPVRRTHKALERLAREQLPELDQKALRAEFNRPDPDTGDARFDELAYYANLREQLEATQTISEERLATLGRQRRDMMLAYVTSLGELGEDRLVSGEISETGLNERGWVNLPLELTVK